MIEVILRQEIDKLGKVGDVVKVKDGYARNFLLPRGLAFEATDSNLKIVEKEKTLKRQELEKKKEEARTIADKLKSFSFTITAEVSDNDKLYGNISPLDIAKACSNEGFEIDKKAVVLDEPIDKLGVYRAKVVLHPEVIQEIKIWVVKK